MKWNNTKMINFVDITKENIKEHNSNWPQFLGRPYKILIIWKSGSWKSNVLFSSVSHLPDIDKIYLNFKDLYESKYQLLIKKP